MADQQAFPFVFSARSDFRARNFAFGGYGPHQALRMLQLGIPRQSDPRQPLHVVYTAIPEHIDRAAGHIGRESGGPFYRVDNGSAVFAGSVSDNARLKTVISIMRRSQVLSAVLRPLVSWYSRNSDVEQFLAIILSLRNIVEQEYQSRFVFVFWDIHPRSWGVLYSGNDGPRERRIAEHICRKLTEAGVRTIRLSERLPEIREPSFYLAEGHPNAKAHAALASMLLQELR